MDLQNQKTSVVYSLC